MFLDGFHMKRKGVQRTEDIMKYQEKRCKKNYIYLYKFIIYIYTLILFRHLNFGTMPVRDFFQKTGRLTAAYGPGGMQP